MHYLPIEFDEEKWDITYSGTENEKLHFIGTENDLLFQFEDIYKEITRLMDFYRYSVTSRKKTGFEGFVKWRSSHAIHD